MKRALCVGVNNYPLNNMDLKGCVNDANDWAKLLVEHYDFAKADVKMLLDKQATKAAILKGLKSLLKGAKRGDVLVFSNSSHGTYLADKNGDEKVYDEAMCPWDTKDNLLVDDELRELFAGLAAGVRLTVISDSCFSGSLTRLAPGPDRRRRYIEPSLLGLREIPNVRSTAKPRTAVRGVYPESAMKEVLLTGCSDKQYSYDARFGDRFNGAMSYHALAAIAAKKYKLTYRDLHTKLVRDVKKAGYDQTPQLEGKTANKDRQVFT